MGDGETVIGMVQMLAGENAQEVVTRVKARVQDIQATLPAGVTIDPLLRPHDLRLKGHADRPQQPDRRWPARHCRAVSVSGRPARGAHRGVRHSPRMLIAFIGMMQAGLSGNLMSLRGDRFRTSWSTARRHDRQHPPANGEKPPQTRTHA